MLIRLLGSDGMRKTRHHQVKNEVGSSLVAKKRPLAKLAEERILQGIRNGRWKHILPGEVTLAGILQVSRETVRAGMDRLVTRKVLLRKKGRRTKILLDGERLSTSSEEVNVVRLLTPQHVHEFTPFMYEWYLNYRALMRGRGIDVQLSTFPKVFRRFSSQELQRHVASLPTSLWLLHIGPPAMQKWFQDQKLPAILAGTPHEGISLPFIDAHYKAAARHAVGLLAAAGHRSLLMVTTAEHFAGDSAAVKGLREGVRKSEHAKDIFCEILEYSDEPDNLWRSLASRLRSPSSPTALLICHQWIVPGVYSALNQLRLKVPEEISLICLHYAPFMRYMTPSLVHYQASPDQFAKKLADLTVSSLKGGGTNHPVNWLIPELVPGKSIAAPRGLG